MSIASVSALQCLSDLIRNLLAQHAAKMLMNDGSTLLAHLRLARVTATADVLEYRKAEPQRVAEGSGLGR